MVYTSKEQLVNGLREQLAKSDRQALKALIEVYSNQLEDEKQTADVRYRNGVGFVSSDAYLLSSFAEQYKSRNSLSKKQLDILHQKMPKYAAQLIKGSLSKGLIVKESGEYKFVK